MQFNKDDEAVESDLEDELDKLFTKRKRRESNTDYENKALVDSFLAQMEVAVEEDMKDYEQGEWHQPAYSEQSLRAQRCKVTLDLCSQAR